MIGILSIGALVLTTVGCGGLDRSSPDTTVRTAQNALDNRSWDRLYKTDSENWKQTYLPRWRGWLKPLLRQTDPDVDVHPGDVEQLSDRQGFRTHMQSLSAHRRWNRILNQYASAQYEIERKGDGTATVKVQSRLPLPYRRGTLQKTPEGWKFEEMSR